jgi:hypothetical protein
VTATVPATGRDVLLQATADAARAAVLRRYRPDSCIATTRVVIEALRYFGVTARPWAVDLQIYNAAAWAARAGDVPAADWPDDAWTIGIAPAGYAASGATDQNNVGHVVAVTAGRLVDASIDQASRPAKGLTLTPVVAALPDGFNPADTTATIGYTLDGVHLLYRASGSGEFRRSRNWSRSPENRAIVAETIRALRDG